MRFCDQIEGIVVAIPPARSADHLVSVSIRQPAQSSGTRPSELRNCLAKISDPSGICRMNSKQR
jgi:hypothetical protein